ncbi:MAG: TonB family protein [Bacteroidia bacterium]|nr:TonB family protein [Bacteroidia bacterium]
MRQLIVISLMLFAPLSHAQESKSVLSPSETISLWHEALTKGDYKLAKKHTSRTSRKYIKNNFGSLKYVSRIYQINSKTITYTKRVIEEEKINGKNAIVTYLMHYSDGTIKRWIDKLFLERGQWKVSPKFVRSSDITPDSDKETHILDASQVFETVEQMPEFPGGQTALMQYLAKNIKYPINAKAKGITGKVFVSFIIDREGNVTNAEVLRGIGGGCDQESLRVINAMPKWIPGKQRGKNVLVQYNLPIRFTL